MDTSSNKWTIYLIIGAIIIMAGACVGTNCYMAIREKEPPQAFTLLTGGLVASLTAMLVRTTPTETPKQPPIPPQHPPAGPAEVLVANTPSNPVPTEEAKT